MAKVTITVEDSEKEGEILVDYFTEPEYKEGDELTLAQFVALKFNVIIEEMQDKPTDEEKETE